ncbi:MAG: hypothetical protein KAR33_12145 [Candidatus Thorarchaeota archaeon]|nr:hypothetical protein [Candidatus Thorarchaeota archaeon]
MLSNKRKGNTMPQAILRYPSEKQAKIWLKRRQGIAPSVIAQKMKVSRAYVSKSLKHAENRIEVLLDHAARINRIKLHHVSPIHGLAVGYCAAHKSETTISYSPTLGVQVWYEHHGDCGSCSDYKDCIKLLDTLAKEWRIPLSSNAPPTGVAKNLFSKITRKLDWIE